MVIDAYHDRKAIGVKVCCHLSCTNLYKPFPLLNMDFPAVLDDEIPTFLADVATSQHQPAIDPSHTVFLLLSGTNDLSNNGFTSDSKSLAPSSPSTLTVFSSSSTSCTLPAPDTFPF